MAANFLTEERYEYAFYIYYFYVTNITIRCAHFYLSIRCALSICCSNEKVNSLDAVDILRVYSYRGCKLLRIFCVFIILIFCYV